MAKYVADEIVDSVADQLFKIGHQILEPDGYPFDIRKLQRVLQNAIEGKFDGTPAAQQYLIAVNYSLSMKEAIAAGNYDWKNDKITAKNFPTKRIGKTNLEIIFVKFDEVMISEDVLRELNEKGLRAAELPELLAFGAKYPDAAREFPMVALGSVSKESTDIRHVPYLSKDAGGNGIGLLPFGSRWRPACRFATVLK